MNCQVSMLGLYSIQLCITCVQLSSLLDQYQLGMDLYQDLTDANLNLAICPQGLCFIICHRELYWYSSLNGHDWQ